MYNWTVLNQTVSEALARGRVGAPVFVRWTAAAARDCEQLRPLLAEMTAYTESWLSPNPRRLYAAGSTDDGHLSLALEFSNGESALLAIALAHHAPTTNLIILGAQGAIYLNDSDILSTPQDPAGRVGSGAGQIVGPPSPETLAAIDRSLAAKQPVSLAPEGDQP